MATMDKIFAGYSARKAALEAITSNPFTQGIAWIEGNLIPLHEAHIPLLDEGFLHGDLTYDVPAVWDGRFFRLDDHLSRLELSCAKLRMRLPIPRDKIKRILIDMVNRSDLRDAYVELIVTRGLQGIRGSKDPFSLTNNLYLFIKPYVWVMEPEVQHTGGHAVVARTVRRVPPGAIDPTVKNLQWGDLVRGTLEAADRGATYPFLTDGDAHLTEGSGYNIVLVKDGVIYTPDRGVLHGVTRKSVMEIARGMGVTVRLEPTPVDLAYQADEIFMCTTAGGIMPITTLEGRRVGDGKVGPLTRMIWDKYWDMHYDPAYSFAIQYKGSSDNRAKL